MVAFILRRVLHMIPQFFLISIVCFVVINLPPGDALTEHEAHLITEYGYSSEAARIEVDHIRHWYGLDQPKPVQYLVWIYRFLRGDFGFSFTYYRGVAEVIWERLFYSLLISTVCLGFTWLIGVPIGILAAIRKYSLTDYSLTVLGYIGLCIPNFFLALVLLVILLFVFDIPPPSGMVSSEFIDMPWNVAKVADMLKRLWLPVVVIGTAGIAQISRIMRSNLLDVTNQAFVQTARSKGLSERAVIIKHATRIAINPLVSLLGMQIPFIISSEIMGSIVLGLPTLGPLLYDALITQDMYVAGAVLMFMGLFLLIGNLLADIILGWIDPRIRFD